MAISKNPWDSHPKGWQLSTHYCFYGLWYLAGGIPTLISSLKANALPTRSHRVGCSKYKNCLKNISISNKDMKQYMICLRWHFKWSTGKIDISVCLIHSLMCRKYQMDSQKSVKTYSLSGHFNLSWEVVFDLRTMRFCDLP